MNHNKDNNCHCRTNEKLFFAPYLKNFLEPQGLRYPSAFFVNQLCKIDSENSTYFSWHLMNQFLISITLSYFIFEPSKINSVLLMNCHEAQQQVFSIDFVHFWTIFCSSYFSLNLVQGLVQILKTA